MAIDSSLIHTVGDIQWDTVERHGKQILARIEGHDLSLAANQGNNWMDGIVCFNPCAIHVMLEAAPTAPTQTPQIWPKFSHVYGDQTIRSDPHRIEGSADNTSAAFRIDVDQQLPSDNNSSTVVVREGVNGSNVLLHGIWNKSACHLQWVSVDGTETAVLNVSLIITDLRSYFGLR